MLFRVPIWYLTLLGLTGLERLRELATSRKNSLAVGGAPSAPATYPLLVAAHVGLLTLPVLEIAITRPRARARMAWVALLLAATGLRLWSIGSLGSAWNVRGQIRDDFAPVTRGPYRYIRHPNYLALIVEFVALPMAGGAWRSAVGLSLLNGYALYDRVREEETQLTRSDSYRVAFQRKARFIPGIV